MSETVITRDSAQGSAVPDVATRDAEHPLPADAERDGLDWLENHRPPSRRQRLEVLGLVLVAVASVAILCAAAVTLWHGLAGR
jgi:hypothetical protein